MEFTWIQYLILGIVQGITEWIPISSSGMSALIMSNFYGVTDVNFILRSLLFLHLGTFFAAFVYFFHDVVKLSKSTIHYKKAKPHTQKTIKFILLATIISGIIGFILMKFLINIDLELTGKTITLIVSALLLITGLIQLKPSRKGYKTEHHLKNSDSWLLGLAQGLAVLPGISRSGITVSTFLIRKFNDTTALRLSFLMSLPIILIGNIFLNVNDMAITTSAIFGMIIAFVFGFFTIHLLMKLSKKINFAWFVIIFAVLMVLSVLI